MAMAKMAKMAKSAKVAHQHLLLAAFLWLLVALQGCGPETKADYLKTEEVACGFAIGLSVVACCCCMGFSVLDKDVAGSGLIGMAGFVVCCCSMSLGFSMQSTKETRHVTLSALWSRSCVWSGWRVQ